jgi:hypothetical protein
LKEPKSIKLETTLIIRTKGSMYMSFKCTLKGRPLGILGVADICGRFAVLVGFGIAGAFWQYWTGALLLEQDHAK